MLKQCRGSATRTVCLQCDECKPKGSEKANDYLKSKGINVDDSNTNDSG